MFVYTIPATAFEQPAAFRRSPAHCGWTYAWDAPASREADSAPRCRPDAAAPAGNTTRSKCRVSQSPAVGRHGSGVGGDGKGSGAAGGVTGRVLFQTLNASGSAAFDLIEGPDAFELITNAPGLSADDIAIDVHEQVLRVVGNTPRSTQLPKQPQQSPQQQADKTWEVLSDKTKETPGSSDDEDGSVEEVDDEEDAKVRHPGVTSPPSSKQATTPKSPPADVEEASTSTRSGVTVDQQQRVLFSERRSPAFMRSFKLPSNVLSEDISASLDKGVLTVRVPKRPMQPKSQPLRIPVNLVA